MSIRKKKIIQKGTETYERRKKKVKVGVMATNKICACV
jgi:hypothetical protein